MIASRGSQLWLEHALALADPAVQAEHTQCEGRPCLTEYTGGMFVMLAPRANGRATRAYLDYRSHRMELLLRSAASPPAGD